MKARKDCPVCQGRGIVLDPDPLKPARLCDCTKGAKASADALGIPNRYRQASFEGFWDWWKLGHREEAVKGMLEEAQGLLDDTVTPVRKELAPQLDHILHACGPYAHPTTGQLGWKRTKPALQPLGYQSLQTWAQQDRPRADFWWIYGEPQSGRSTLAAAALKAWCERTGRDGRFVSVRTLSQELKDTYHDVRSFQNRDFRSERDQVEPLMDVPCLVLDDWDRVDSDVRVGRALAQLLDHRYSEGLPTVLTALRSPGDVNRSETHPLARLEDLALVRRLEVAQRVELCPTLERLMQSARRA